MFGANKKNFGVEFCERGHKLLGPSQVESLKKKKIHVNFPFFLSFLSLMAHFFPKINKYYK
jgi:hypothetical protein